MNLYLHWYFFKECASFCNHLLVRETENGSFAGRDNLSAQLRMLKKIARIANQCGEVIWFNKKTIFLMLNDFRITSDCSGHNRNAHGHHLKYLMREPLIGSVQHKYIRCTNIADENITREGSGKNNLVFEMQLLSFLL